jgi:hypothetical protein
MLPTAGLTLSHMSTIRSPFSCQHITSNFSSLLIVFHRFFTSSALGDVDLCLSLMLVREANAVGEEIISAA